MKFFKVKVKGEIGSVVYVCTCGKQFADADGMTACLNSHKEVKHGEKEENQAQG